MPEGPGPTTREEVFAALNFEDLPNRSVWEEVVLNMLRDKFQKLVLVFTHYCRQGSDCATIDTASKLKLGGFKKLVKDAGLEVRVFDFEGMSRLFAKMSLRVNPEKKSAPIPNPELAELRLHQFISLLVNLAFLRENPRFASTKESAKAKEETVPVLQAVQNMLNDFLPKMQTSNAAEFRVVLKSDKEALAACASYKGKVMDWLETLKENAAHADTDIYTEYCNYLQEQKVLGEISLQTTESTGLQVTHKASLTPLQARHCFLEAQDPERLSLGKPVYGAEEMMEALARCGDKKYSTILEMTFSERVRGMLQNVFGDATEIELITEAVAPAANAEGNTLDEKSKKVMEKNWLVCWRNMTFKDLHGYPLWETQLHDILKGAFGELQHIFLYYCGTSIAGSESIHSATKVGLMEMLQFAKDVELCTKEFKIDDVTRHFVAANAEANIDKSGSADRHKLKGSGRLPRMSRVDSTPPPPPPAVSHKRRGDDMQLNLIEFVNFLARVAFWRANPQWGSKYNKKELTPVPEAVDILMNTVVLPKAKRDRSSEFKALLSKDAATQLVLSEYREKLQNWVRPILRSLRKSDVPNPQMTYQKWGELMSGITPSGEGKGAFRAQAACPKMVGEWTLEQESQITGDDRTNRKNQIHFKAKLSVAQCHWNFLRSQTVEQLQGDVEVKAESSEFATLDFAELNECIARCAVNCYDQLLNTYLPSHGRMAMTMADAVKSWLQVLLFEKSHETCMWEFTVIKAERYDWKKMSKAMAGQDPKQHKLWLDCWRKMPLMDVHYFPVWEKGVHDVLQAHFPALLRIFSHYCKGISGIDSATDALEMELEEFHDFVKDAKLETRMVNFTAMEVIFAKANAENTADAFAQRVSEKRNSVVQADMERAADKPKRRGSPGHTRRTPVSPKRGAFPDVNDRFAPDYPEHGSLKHKRPNNRLSLNEFLACLVRLSFLRANPKFGQYDNKAKLVPLPGCLDRMLKDVVLPNAKQDMSSMFREELAKDLDVQAVFAEYREQLQQYYTEAASAKTKGENKMSMETWLDICRGFLSFKQRKGAKNLEPIKTNGEDGKLGEGALVGDCTVNRESDITGDERCKEKFSCRLTILEAKMAFLNSQSLDQMSSGDASEGHAMATLDFDEFCECLARCGRDKYGEIKQMPLSDCVRGLIQNLLGEKGDEAVIRDSTYIRADRYDWRQSKPLQGQHLSLHRKWLECWQNIEVSDLHHFPLWEKGVHDVLQESFQDLISIFAHYAKSIGGSTTAEDAVEMTLSEFKDLVRDTALETKDLKFDVMCNMFKKANALNNNEAHSSRVEGRKTAAAVADSTSTKAGFKGVKRSASARKLRDDELDQELVLYEFVEVLIRVSFWRANPFHGIHKLAQTLTPLPDCLHQMLHEVVLPNAQRDNSSLFKEWLANDKGVQAVLQEYEPQLLEWFNSQTQSMFLRGEGRRLQYQLWQDVLKKKKHVGVWEINQDSEITGDERCRIKHKCSLSLPQAKFAFSNSQSLDQMSAGVATDKDSMTTLDFEEFKECIARCGVDKYKAVRQMSPAAAIKGMIHNLLEIANEEEVMWSNTLIKAQRFDWKRYSTPLEAQSLHDHKKWLEVWQRIEVSDVYYFPIWEKGVHDCLQKYFADLNLIFLAYCRSLLGSDTAEDALEMELAEFHDFVEECGLVTKEVNFDVMTNMFIKANAVNSNAAHEQLREKRTSSRIKDTSTSGGLDKKEVSNVKGNDGTDAKKDQELVLYEFLNMLIRISFLRANPTYGNYGSKRKIVHLPDCLEAMITNEILPRARRDTSASFRDSVMQEPSVIEVLEECRDKVLAWYQKTTADDTKETDITDRLSLKQWMRVCDLQDLVGNWQVFRQSSVTGDPNCRTEYKWRFSMAQAKMAFMDSQNADQFEAAAAKSDDEATTLDFDEFLECLARCGLDKYRAVKEVSPAAAVRGFIDNLLLEKSTDEVVVQATYIHCNRFDAEANASPIEGETEEEMAQWLECWAKMEVMDIYLWPTWEEEVHNILHPIFKDLERIFLAYTRSFSDDSAEDALSMSMDEFHDFVIDVGLETKKYTFDVMSNQFIKANSTNSNAVREKRREARESIRGGGQLDLKKKKSSMASMSEPNDAVKDAKLVLWEFLNMLVRIAFWRANPNFGLFGNKDPVVLVPLALSDMLNNVILPNAKRENSAEFRTKEMRDPALKAVLEEYKPKLLAWYKKKTKDDTEEDHVSDKLGLDEWLRVLDRQDLVGVWEVEQLSEITGDISTKGNIKCRLSMAAAKAVFMDSQHMESITQAQSATSENATLDFEEWLECLARLGVLKYQSVKQMTKAAAVKGFLANFFGEMSEEEVMREGTYIRATRFDWKNESKPLERETKEQHAAWLEHYQHINFSDLYGFPLWEREVHDQLQQAFADLSSIFRSYCRSVGESADKASTMELEEFHDFVIDCRLETNDRGEPYTFAKMKAQFNKADSSGKGIAGPAANKELVLHEFLNAIVRVAFHRLNPKFSAFLVEDIIPVPQALDVCLNECILPNAHRDDAAEFRVEIMTQSAVKAVIEQDRERLQQWYEKIPLDELSRVTVSQWIITLKALNVLGTFTSVRGSDVVGDSRIGTEFKCRLSEPQAKAAFVNAQKETSNTVDVALDFEEMLECVARCGVDKYRAVKEFMDPAAAVAGFIANILGDANEDQVITKHTYVFADRFDAAEAAEGEPTDDDWLATWKEMQLSTLYLFPTWEKEVHDIIKPNFAQLKSVFRAYAAGTTQGNDSRTLEIDEFHDFVIEADLITKEYGFHVITSQFSKAIEGGDDAVMELSEFLTMIVRIAFYRANPRYGSTEMSKPMPGAQKETYVPIPTSLQDILQKNIFPNCRRDDGPPFSEILEDANVQAEIRSKRQEINDMYESISEGRQGLELKQWIDALQAKLLFSDLLVLEHRCRFTEPQARNAFACSTTQRDVGLQPEEFVECIARCAVEKYKYVLPMSKAQAVDGFIQNLLGTANEEEVIYNATGHGDPPASKLARKPPAKPRLPNKSAVQNQVSASAPVSTPEKVAASLPPLKFSERNDQDDDEDEEGQENDDDEDDDGAHEDDDEEELNGESEADEDDDDDI